MKRVRETQKKTSKEFLKRVLDQELQPNFRSKCPCTCPKVAKMSENQFVQDTKLKIAKEMDRDNTPLTERTMETQNPKQSRPSTPSRQISHHSDWSDSEDGKDDQARAKPLGTQEDLQPSTSFTSCASDATPLR